MRRIIGVSEGNNADNQLIRVSTYRDVTWDEYVVTLHIDSVHQKNADYHTSDRQDAKQTALEMYWQMGATA